VVLSELGSVGLDVCDAREMLELTGRSESGLDQLARIGFATLGLQTYLTAGLKKSHSWTIPQAAKSPHAVGVIHTDFEKGFVKVEVAEALSKGKARMERKDDVVQDGGVVEYGFNRIICGLSRILYRFR
jgi:ribosome-binding ATPase YchF (GTP1/OBG family)